MLGGFGAKVYFFFLFPPLQANHLIAMLGDVCTPESCPEMDAQSQTFLCAAHNPPASCCAMDYMVHTVEKMIAFVNNTTLFPGRMDIPAKSAEQFPSAVRRLYRLFLHAYDKHREEYDQFEEATLLCRRFSCFALKYRFLERGKDGWVGLGGLGRN